MRNKYITRSNQIAELDKIQKKVQKTKSLIKNGKYCPVVIKSLNDITRSVLRLENKVLKGHISTCVDEVIKESTASKRKAMIDEVLSLIEKPHGGKLV